MSSQPLSPLPVPAGADVESFQIHSRLEIVALLREVVERRALATLHFDAGRGFIVTTLLAVNPEFEEVVVDCGADRGANTRLMAAARLTAVTHLDHIRIQFVTGAAQETMFEGLPALRVRLPSIVLRLQRRNAYRVRVPAVPPLHCWARRPGAEAAAPRSKLRIADLSVEGLAMLAPEAEFAASEGDLLEGCRVELPGHEPIVADLEVRNRIAAGGEPGRPVRYGCRFRGLPGATAALIQRVILAIERSRHAAR